MIRRLAARASNRWWLLWKPFWRYWPLVLQSRIQLLVIVLAGMPLIVRVGSEVGALISLASTVLVAYGAYLQLKSNYRKKQFMPWDLGKGHW